MRESDKDPNTLFQMRLPAELHAKFSATAKEQDLPMSHIARRLFEREIERHVEAKKKKQRRA